MGGYSIDREYTRSPPCTGCSLLSIVSSRPGFRTLIRGRLAHPIIEHFKKPGGVGDVKVSDFQHANYPLRYGLMIKTDR